MRFGENFTASGLSLFGMMDKEGINVDLPDNLKSNLSPYPSPQKMHFCATWHSSEIKIYVKCQTPGKSDVFHDAYSRVKEYLII